MPNSHFLAWLVIICAVLTAIVLSAAQTQKAHDGTVLLCSAGDQDACNMLYEE